MFECARCTRQVTNEERYIFVNSTYCRACMIFIENSGEFETVLNTNSVLMRLDQIEN